MTSNSNKKYYFSIVSNVIVFDLLFISKSSMLYIINNDKNS